VVRSDRRFDQHVPMLPVRLSEWTGLVRVRY
jgi:hypothetical protein